MKTIQPTLLNRSVHIGLALFCAASLMACVVTSSPPVEKVVMVRLVQDNGTVAPEYRYREEVIINGNLTTEWNHREFKDSHQRRGKITPEQLQTLKDLIQQSNYLHVKVKETIPTLGGSGGGIGIETNLGHRGFNYDNMPEGVAKVARYAGSLSPKK